MKSIPKSARCESVTVFVDGSGQLLGKLIIYRTPRGGPCYASAHAWGSVGYGKAGGGGYDKVGAAANEAVSRLISEPIRGHTSGEAVAIMRARLIPADDLGMIYRAITVAV